MYRFEYISCIVFSTIDSRFHFSTERRVRERGQKGNKVEKTKNFRNTGTEGMEIIKSIFGEQLEQDSS